MIEAGVFLKSIFDSTDDVWFFVAPDYSIRLFNKKALENGKILHNRELREGDSILQYARDTKNKIDESFIECFKKALEGEIVKYEQHIVYETSSFWFTTKYVPVIAEGKLAGVSVTIIDVTQENLMRAAQERANDEIRVLVQKKDEFLSIASHELKLPLASVKGYNQIVSRISKDDIVLEYLTKERQQIKKLERLISDLLDANKISQNHLQYQKDDFNLVEIIKEAIEATKLTYTGKDIAFKHPELLVIHGDKIRIEQVIINLLSNAIKYSPHSQRVEVDLKTDNTSAIVIVKDFGVGIAKAHLKDIFERFYRVEKDTKNISGLGLGLFISMQIINEHGGSIWLESEEGKGSIFYVSLPLPHKNLQ